MEAFSIMASPIMIIQLVVKASQALHVFSRAVLPLENDCDKLRTELNMLQEALSHFEMGPGSSPVEKLLQTYPMEISEVIDASKVSLEELLSVLERAQHHARYPYRRVAYIGLPKTLESTRDNIRDQREKLLLLLSLRDAEPNRRVDVAKDKDKQHEHPTLTSILPYGANVGDIHENLSESSWWIWSIETSMMPPHPGRYRDSNGVGMEAGGMNKRPRSHWEEIFHRLLPRLCHLDAGQIRATEARDRDTDSRFLFSQCVEGGLVVTGAAGAAMTGCWSQTRNADVWTLSSAIGASTLDPDRVQAASIHSHRVTELLSLQTLIPKYVFDSPVTLVTSIAVTTLAMTAYHYLHRHEKYQDPLIFGIAGGGALVGRLIGLDGTGVLLRVIPWCVLVSLLLSAAWSPRLAEKPHPQVDDGAMNLKVGALNAM